MAKPKKTKPSTGNGTSKPGGSAHQKSAPGGDEPSKIWSDERFAHLVSDPRFQGIPRAEKKVKIDARFKSMFEDERFNVKHTIDKYGRKVEQRGGDELKKYYELGSEDEEEGRGSEVDSLELDAEEKAMAMTDKVKSRLEDLKVDYARGEGAIATDSSSDDDSEDGDGLGEEDEVFIDHVWGELDADAERTEDSSRRLALCNMDWDRVRAVDIMVMLSSFLPRGSTILSVTIYPSEFGKERMKEEDECGPQELTAQNSEDSADLEAEEDDKEKQVERLREYQLNRLKYYYAVVECDSLDTADKLYKECDGVEYESTANKIDLRFIPDEMEFEDAPKDCCSELPEIGKYEPRVFTTTALNQAKVELTWDENDVERKEFNEKIRAGKLDEVTDVDLKKYVACSSSSEGEEDEGAGEELDSGDDSDESNRKSKKQSKIDKYKALLGELKEQEDNAKDEEVQMEFSWKVDKGAKESSEEESDSKPKKRDNANPFDKILEKAKEKKKRRKELKKKKKRGELNSDGEVVEDSSDDDLPHGIDLNDPFFAGAFDEKDFKKPSSKKDKTKKANETASEDEEEAARKRAELELILDDGEDDKSHFNLKRIQENEIDLKTVSKSKRKRILKKTKRQIEEQKQLNAAAAMAAGDGFDIDLDDDRFKAVYEKPEFNIDPTNPSFKKTKAMEKLIEEKLRKRPLRENDVPVLGEAKKAKKDISTTLLVKSIKRKIGK